MPDADFLARASSGEVRIFCTPAVPLFLEPVDYLHRPIGCVVDAARCVDDVW
jgi:hypothetical protein